MKKRLLSLFTSAIMLAGMLNSFVFAEAAHAAPDTEPELAPLYRTVNSKTSETGYVDTYLVDENGNRVEMNYPSTVSLMSEDNLPSKYMSEDITSVKNQGQEGTCWAHGTIGAIEANLVHKGLIGKDDIDLSEAHLAYFTKNPRDDRYQDGVNLGAVYEEGANDYKATAIFSKWSGPELEENVPYSKYMNSNRKPVEEEKRYDSCARIKKLVPINPQDQNAIKEAVMEYGAATLCYPHYPEYFYNDSYYYYSKTQSGAPINETHEVLIVGWDDSFSKDYFNTGADGTKPTKDGAWIIKNSWGESYHDNGYFYMPYENWRWYVNTYDVDFAGEYDNNYGYTGAEYSMNAGSKRTAANVFTADSNETLKAISLFAFEPADIDIYIFKGGESGAPDTGEMVLHQEHSMTGMYEEITLNKEIQLTAGERFSVVIDGAQIYFEDNSSKYTFHEGESYVIPRSCNYDGTHTSSMYNNKSMWLDTATGKSEYSNLSNWIIGNAYIRAYTDDEGSTSTPRPIPTPIPTKTRLVEEWDFEDGNTAFENINPSRANMSVVSGMGENTSKVFSATSASSMDISSADGTMRTRLDFSEYIPDNATGVKVEFDAADFTTSTFANTRINYLLYDDNARIEDNFQYGGMDAITGSIFWTGMYGANEAPSYGYRINNIAVAPPNKQWVHITIEADYKKYNYSYSITSLDGNTTYYSSSNTSYFDGNCDKVTGLEIINWLKNTTAYIDNIKLYAKTPIAENEDDLPSSYRSPYVTSVKDQNSGYACWAFTGIGLIEANLIKKGLVDKDSVDFSEAHLVYFAANPRDEVYQDGENIGLDRYDELGSDWNTISTLQKWSGPELEKNVPYLDYFVIKNNPVAEEKRFNSYARVKKLIDIPLEKEAMKKAIMEYGGLSLSYHEAAYFDGNSYTDDYYNEGKYYYYSKEPAASNHGAMIVGWDDNIPANKFGTGSDGTKPTTKGAWIIKNSFGDWWGDDGYSYISYENGLVCVRAYDADLAGEYDNNYGYTGAVWEWQFANAIPTANVFTANKSETLKAIGVTVVNPVDIDIYIVKNPTNYPDDGEVALHQKHSMTGMYEEIKLDEDIPLSEGDKFSVIISGANVWFEGKSDKFTHHAGETYMLDSTSTYNENTMTSLRNYWKDTSVKSDVLVGNAYIRAYTDDEGSTSTPRPIPPPEKYTITFVNYDNSVLQETDVTEGLLPEYTNETPSRLSDEQYSYTFSGWQPEITAATEAATYTAQFTAVPREYTVTLNTNGGTINSGNITKYAVGTGATLPTDVTRDYDTFEGWYDNEECTGEAITTVSATDTGDKTYYAKWNEKTALRLQPSKVRNEIGSTTGTIDSDKVWLSLHDSWKAGGTVYFGFGGIEGFNPTLVEKATISFTALSYETTNRDRNFIFELLGISNNWTAGTAVNDSAYTGGESLASATGKRISSTSCQTNNGKGDVFKPNVAAEFDVTDYVKTLAKGTSEISFGAAISKGENGVCQMLMKNDPTLTIVMAKSDEPPAPQEYTVTLNTNGGTINSGNITRYTVGTGATLPTDVTRSGYTFGGWYDNAACTGTAVTVISTTDTGDKTYWAKWTTVEVVKPTPKLVKTWDFEDGNVAFTNINTARATLNIDQTTYNSKVLAVNCISANVKEGVLDGTARAQLDFSEHIPDNATGVKVEFDAADFTTIDKTRISYILYDSDVRILDNFRAGQDVSTGALFQMGMVKDSAFNIIGYSGPIPATDWVHVTVDIDYETSRYTYTLKSLDGATTFVESSSSYYDTTCKKLTGIEIINWVKETSAYIDNIKLYVTAPEQEKPAEYGITLNTNGGTINSGNITRYTVGTGATLPTDVTRSGYTFGGWYDNAACTGTAVTVISTTDTGDKTYWAKWTTVEVVKPTSKLVKTWDFEDGSTAFTNANPDYATLSVVEGYKGNASKALSVTSADEIDISYADKFERAQLDFSNYIPDNAENVKIEFDAADFTTMSSTRANYLLYDGNVRTVDTLSQAISDTSDRALTIRSTGVLFQMGQVGGSAFRVNNAGKTTPTASWAHITIDVDCKANKYSYSVTSLDGATSYFADSNVSYYDAKCTKVTGLEILDWQKNSTAYIDNIKLYVTAPKTEDKPSDEKCVRIIAEYKADGSLEKIVSIDEISISEIEEVSNTSTRKTFYWNSLSGMKPVRKTNTN